MVLGVTDVQVMVALILFETMALVATDTTTAIQIPAVHRGVMVLVATGLAAIDLIFPLSGSLMPVD